MGIGNSDRKGQNVSQKMIKWSLQGPLAKGGKIIKEQQRLLWETADFVCLQSTQQTIKTNTTVPKMQQRHPFHFVWYLVPLQWSSWHNWPHCVRRISDDRQKYSILSENRHFWKQHFALKILSMRPQQLSFRLFFPNQTIQPQLLSSLEWHTECKDWSKGEKNKFSTIWK